MSNLLPRLRRLLGVTGGTLVLVGSTVALAAPAHAVNHDGIMSLKGAGSVYSSLTPTVALAGSSGQTLTFGMKVYNAGSEATQYNVRLSVSGLPATVGLYSGSTLLSTATTADGYYTVPLAPQTGVSYALKVKSTLPVGSPLRATVVNVTFTARDGTFLNSGTARFEQKAPFRGSDLADVTAKNGSQPYVGSHSATQYASSPATYFDGSQKFTVKLAVNAGAAHRLHAYMPSTGNSCFAVKVLAGTTDVTSSVATGAYLTKVLAPGQSVLLTVQVSRIGFQFCANAQFDIYGYTESGQAVSAVRLLMP